MLNMKYILTTINEINRWLGQDKENPEGKVFIVSSPTQPKHIRLSYKSPNLDNKQIISPSLSPKKMVTWINGFISGLDAYNKYLLYTENKDVR